MSHDPALAWGQSPDTKGYRRLLSETVPRGGRPLLYRGPGGRSVSGPLSSLPSLTIVTTIHSRVAAYPVCKPRALKVVACQSFSGSERLYRQASVQ